MTRSKRKGDGYERELAKWLDFMLFANAGNVQRAPLSGGGRYVGGGGRADLIGTPTVWGEAKRTEKFQPYAAMEQAETGIKNAGSDEMPVVMQRRNRMATEDSLVVMRLKDWVSLYSSWLKECGHDVWEPTLEMEVLIDFDEEFLERVIPQEDDRGDNIVRLFPMKGAESDGEED